ncbi:MAG TPA: hypothetical protein VL574_13405 [Stellaceae bacterium]|nr:hypothetical protein [Stellaceae bacterium]
MSLVSLPAMAQEQQYHSAHGVTLGSNAHTETGEACVEVEIGGQKSTGLDCLNQKLKQATDSVQPVGNIPPVDASSPAVKVGGFNETAMQQQYGQNWGKSVVPFRPAPLVFH